MTKESENVKLLINITKAQSILVKRFDRGMGNGIGYNEFLILYYLNQANEQTMRRIEIAEKISMTASGVTRMLLPMEKIGLVVSGSAHSDSRVRSVSISKAGKEKFDEAMERFELLAQEVLSGNKISEIKSFSNILSVIIGKILIS